ncbi:MAG TPA: histidine kinase [Thermoanaerobaculia bacterium]|jgi:signal transduction histidine kinase|nr:histidine kinase [Thermoanaerobaculia bacterium]
MRARLAFSRTLLVIGAWLPFLFFWVLFFMTYARGSQTLAAALSYGLVAIGSAAVLGVAVWRFCARNPWPLAVRGSFYAKHLAAAAVYAAAWILAMYSGDAALDGKPVLEFLKQGVKSSVIGWQFLMGVWLYGLVAGVAYGIQTRRRANESENRALRAEAALVGARLEALRSRLNPHFLFNALHTVGALVRQDAALAESAVEKLGDILRQTLREDAGETVSFREEWELTKRYLEFEQLRYGERLAVSSEIDPRAFACRTPTFALQTLVENAVRHSIANRVEGGRVEITARVDDGTFLLRVRDDGTGPRAPSNGGTGYGLRALEQRLEAVYGDAGGLTIVTDTPKGYEVSVRIPCQAPPPEDPDDA